MQSVLPQPLTIHVHSITWPEDHHWLFDYESQEVLRSSFEITSNCIISRCKDQISLQAAPSSDSLLSVLIDKSACFLMPTSSYPLWQVVRSLSSSQPAFLPLHEGTIIKIGRIEFQIRALKREVDAKPELTLRKVTEKSLSCRFCMCEGSVLDPLAAVCRCSGTMQYVHIRCLQDWVLTKAEESPESVLVRLRPVHCEVCRAELPAVIRVDDQRYELWNGTGPKEPFLVMEQLQVKNGEKRVFCASLHGKEAVVIGRKSEGDVCINDRSVSRCHARVRIVEETFVIEDTQSKFGTLVMRDGPIMMEDRIAIQCGRTVLELLREGK
jgi:hypothetical protein